MDCEYCQILTNTYFEDHLRTAASTYNFFHKFSLAILAPFLFFKVWTELWSARESFFHVRLKQIWIQLRTFTKGFKKYSDIAVRSFSQIGVLKSLAKIIGKLLCRSPFLNKAAGLQKFLRTPLLQDTCRRLLLQLFLKASVNSEGDCF